MNRRRSYSVGDTSESVVSKSKRGRNISKGLASYHLHHTKLSERERGCVAAYKAAKEDVGDSVGSFVDRWFGAKK